MADLINGTPASNFAVHRYLFEYAGYDQLAVQKVDLPSVEVLESKYGGFGETIKNPSGYMEVGDLVVTSLIRMETTSNSFMDWFLQAYDPTTFVGELPSILKRNLVLKLLNNKNIPFRTFFLFNCWVKKIEYDQLDRESSDPFKTMITLSVQRQIVGR